MEKLTKIFVSAIILTVMAGIYSCSSKEEGLIQNGTDQTNHCKLVFNVTKTCFDDEPNTRSASQWENGDTIYLLFTSGTELVYGDAVYTDGEWNVNYNGKLVSNEETTCKAFYFEDNVSATHSTITLNESTAIYEDTIGKYTLTDGSLSITANLKPKTGRIRLKGENHEEVKLYGITHNTSFNRYTGEYTTSKGVINAKVASEYTPYIYGEFTDSVEPRINLWKTDEGFTRIFPNDINKPGESGYISIPTSSAHNGWQNNVTFKVNEVEFTMIPVAYSSGNFLLAMTETTEELYEALMNDGNSSLLPKTGLSKEDWDSFLSELIAEMELNFRFPARDEWKAAFGSDIFSGSSDIDEVAWYKDNSNNTRHNVASKQPNEFGFYDMSGNVFEYTSYYGECYGGSYDSSSGECKKDASYITYNTTNGQRIGFRLAMSN